MLFCSPYPLHFEKEGKLTEINLKPETTESGFKLETPYYKFEFIKFPFKIIFNDEWVRSLDRPKTDFISGSDIEKIFPGIDLYFRFFPESVSVFLRMTEGHHYLNWKNQNGDFKQDYNYDVPMTVKCLQFGKETPWQYPEQKAEGTVEFKKYTESDHYEDFPCMETYYTTEGLQ